MPRTTKPLNFTEVDRAKPRAKEYNLADGKGLFLRVKPNGSKLWLFNYKRPYIAKRTNISFGNFPEVTLEQARGYRNQALVLLKKNTDPKEYWDEQHSQQQKAHVETFEIVARKWIELKKTKVSEDHSTDIMRSLELHIFSGMGTTPIHKVRAKQTIDILQPLAAKGSLETIKRLCQRLNEVMVYATNTGLIEHNPLFGIKEAFANPTVKHMPSIPPQQLPELMRALSNASIKKITRCLIEWQLHTMVRPSEAAGARWNEIDLDSQLWVIPAERMKAKRIHKVPLTTQTLALLEAMKPISEHRDFIFPGDRNSNKHANDQTANTALKRMGFGGVLVSHGLRSIASTALNDQGFDYDVIESALAHIDSNQVRKAYNRADYIERRRPLMQWWSDFISTAATGDMSLATGTKGLRAVS